MVSTFVKHHAKPVPHDGVAIPTVRAGERDEAVELGPEEDRVGRRLLTTLVRQQRHRHRPPGTDLAHDVLDGRSRAGEVHLAELALVVEHLDGPHVDAGLVHRAQEERDAAVPARVGIGAGEEEDPASRRRRARSRSSDRRSPTRRLRGRRGSRAQRDRSPRRVPSSPDTSDRHRRGCAGGTAFAAPRSPSAATCCRPS